MQDKAAAPAQGATPATSAPAAPATAPAAGGGAVSGGLAGQLARSIPPAPVIDTRTPAVVIRGGQPLEIPAGLEPAADEKKVIVRARFSDMAAGELRLQRRKSGLETEGSGFQGLSLNHPLLNPLRAVGIEPVIAVKVRDGTVLARASGMKGNRVWADAEELLKNVQRHAEALGWHGLDGLRLTGLSNSVAGDTLTLGASNLHFGISKFLNASGSIAATNRTVTFTATATGKVPGLGTVTVPIELAPDGTLIGSAKIDVAELKGFSGSLDARYARGLIDIQGTIHYANDKFGGSVTLAVTDAASAKLLTQAHMPQEVASVAPAGQAATAAPTAAPAAAPAAPATEAQAPKPGPRVVCGWGTVNVQLADWLSGEAMVVVDHLGDVTIVGKITPKMTKPLFEQRDYIKQLPKLEVRAAYGLPVVGNIFLFANVGLELVAKLGPATLDRMEMTGTYSTKPEVLQSFGLTGTLNISAFAGVRLSAEGGAGLEILDHDIKAGAKISALAGIRGYVDATPRIGYREIADPQAGKRGEFFIGGHLDIAAQPFLLLSGELFVSLDSPWWSPAPSKRWPWPLGQLEYPLPGEFGIGADVEHVLGSGKSPEIAFSDVAFDSSRLMTDLMDDHVPAKKSGGEVEKKGEWKESAEPGAAAPAAAAPGAAAAPPAAAKPAAKGGAAGAAGKPKGAAEKGAGAGAPATEPEPEHQRTPAEQKRWQAGLDALKQLATKSKRDSEDSTEIEHDLAAIKKSKGFTVLTATAAGDHWDVTAGMSPAIHFTSILRDVSEEEIDSALASLGGTSGKGGKSKKTPDGSTSEVNVQGAINAALRDMKGQWSGNMAAKGTKFHAALARRLKEMGLPASVKADVEQKLTHVYGLPDDIAQMTVRDWLVFEGRGGGRAHAWLSGGLPKQVLDTQVGELKVDAIFTAGAQTIVFDLTSRERDSHVAKTLLYTLIGSRDGQLHRVQEYYWAAKYE